MPYGRVSLWECTLKALAMNMIGFVTEGREKPAGKTGSAIVVNNGKYTKMGVS